MATVLSNLFTKAPKHSVNYDMYVNTSKIGEMESSSLSNLTNFKELRKVLKSFKMVRLLALIEYQIK